MTKEEICKSVIDVVLSVTEPDTNWHKSHDEESVMTRALIINSLFKLGFSREQIRKITGFQQTAIATHINKWEDRLRCNRLLVSWNATIQHKLSAIDFFTEQC